MAYCAHRFDEDGELPFPDAPRLCTRCGALVVPAYRMLAHVAEARAILERSPHRWPSLSSTE